MFRKSIRREIIEKLSIFPKKKWKKNFIKKVSIFFIITKSRISHSKKKFFRRGMRKFF